MCHHGGLSEHNWPERDTLMQWKDQNAVEYAVHDRHFPPQGGDCVRQGVCEYEWRSIEDRYPGHKDGRKGNNSYRLKGMTAVIYNVRACLSASGRLAGERDVSKFARGSGLHKRPKLCAVESPTDDVVGTGSVATLVQQSLLRLGLR